MNTNPINNVFMLLLDRQGPVDYKDTREERLLLGVFRTREAAEKKAVEFVALSSEDGGMKWERCSEGSWSGSVTRLGAVEGETYPQESLDIEVHPVLD